MIDTACVRSIRIHIRADVIMRRELDSRDVMRIPAYFSTRPQDVDEANSPNLDTIISELSSQIDSWLSRGSGFVIERIVKFVVCITEFRLLHGSSFIKTPQHIQNKICTVNVRNNDQKCFIWSVLASLYPSSNNPHRQSHYAKYVHTLNVEGLSFSLQIKDIQNSKLRTRRSASMCCHLTNVTFV